MLHTCTNENCVDDQGNRITKIEVIEIDPANHVWDEGIVKTPATCLATGEMLHTCTNENCVDGEGNRITEIREIAIDPENHVWNAGEEMKAPTCVEEGEMRYTCTNEACVDEAGERITKIEKLAIDPDNHAYDEENGVVTLEPTCVAEGVLTVTCIRETVDENGEKVVCGATDERVIPVDPEKHNFTTEGVEDPKHTCEQEGVMNYVCLNTKTVVGEDGTETVITCEVVHTEAVPAHDAQPIGEMIPATCLTDGITAGSYCPTCD